MTYITKLAVGKTTANSKIMIVALVGFVLLLLQPSTTQAQWSTSGNNISNTNSGNVGIGTTSPSFPVEVRGSAVVFNSDARAVIGNYDLSSMAQGVGGGIQFGGKYHSNGTVAGFASISGIKENATDNDFSSALVFTTRSSPNAQAERMRISSGGNVGVGTTSPGARLDVSGSTFLQYVTLNDATSYGAISFRETGGSSKGHIGMTGSGSGSTYVGGANAFQIWNGQNTPMVFGTNGSERVRIDASGSVGIGTSTPNSSYKLDVNGNANVSGNLNSTGNITGGTIQAKYQDVAEWVESSQQLSAGTVVVLDQTRSNQVIASSQAYDTRVAGVISAQPGITLGANGAGKVLVATTGRVRIKVDASQGSIQVGDLLVTSDVAGAAMKSQPISLGGIQIHRPGTLIGKALEPLENGVSEILVLLSLQ